MTIYRASDDAGSDVTIGEIRFLLYNFKEEIESQEKKIRLSNESQELKEIRLGLLGEQTSMLNLLITTIEDHLE